MKNYRNLTKRLFIVDDDGFKIPAKRCTICFDVKPRNNAHFYISKNNVSSYCIECHRLRYLEFDVYQFMPIINYII